MPVIAQTARVDRSARPSRRHAALVRIVDAWKTPAKRRLILALGAAGASAVAFARVTEDYLTNDPLAHWDLSFAGWLAHHRSAAGVDVSRVVTNLGSPAVSVAVATVVCVFLLRRRRLADAALLPLALAGAEALNLALKVTFHRERPEVAFVHLDTYSYPSGHAMVAVAAYGTFAYLLWRATDGRRVRVAATAAAVVIVTAIGASRIYLGVHYLSDVLGGFAAGCTWLALAIALHLHYGERFSLAFDGSRLDRLARRVTRS